jgi:ferrous iron transport protein A
MRLADLPPNTPAVILDVEDVTAPDPVSVRLRELGFVADEPVRIIAAGPFGRDPLLIQIGYTRFALRRTEAARVRIRTEATA